MRIREFERNLVFSTAWGAAEIDQRTRRLRELGELPVGGRGLNAPEITPRHAAMILIALAAADSAPRTAQVVRDYPSLRSGEGAAGGQFLDALVEILSAPATAETVRDVRVCRSEASATITMINGDQLHYRDPQVNGTANPGGYVEAVLTGELLHNIAVSLSAASE